MAGEFSLKVVTPDGEVWSGKATSVVVPGLDGYFGVWAGHAPMIAGMDIGAVMVASPDETHIAFLAVSGGFVEVSSEGVTVLAEGADLPHDIDMDAVQEVEAGARKQLAEFFEEDDINHALNAVRRSLAQKHVVERSKAKPTSMF